MGVENITAIFMPKMQKQRKKIIFREEIFIFSR
jgi:hypothetical protein